VADYTKVNIKEEVEDQAPNFGLSPDLESRMARVPLELEGFGVSYQRIAPNFRVPFAHRHKQQEEVYIIVGGGGCAKLGDDIVELKEWDALRVPNDTVRGFEAGPEGMELIAIGAPNTGPGDAELDYDFWAG
jgi:mannose-6-phosphate isomerase-like protein (cupin superfamily)